MKNISVDEKKNLIDFVTDSMFSMAFLESITDIIFSDKRDQITVGQFYDSWLYDAKTKEKKIPFSLGAFVGYMYCGFTIINENWEKLIPDELITKSGEDWGLKNIKIEYTKKQNITIKFIIKKIRNSLSHGRFTIDIAPDLVNREQSLEKTSFTFIDINPHCDNDKFQVSINMRDITRIIRKIQSVAHTHVKSS